MDRGYFAVWRKIEDHPFYKERRTFSKYEAWLDILMKAQHKKEPQEVVLGMTVLTCNYGETLRSTRSWAGQWGWSEAKVRRFFSLLEKLGQITSKSEGKTTRITILNYEQYDPRVTHDCTSSRRVTDALPATDKNEKNEKNINKYSSAEEYSSTEAPSTPSCPHQQIRNLYNEILPELPRCISTNATFDRNLRSRWREDTDRQCLEWWQWFFSQVKESDFLMGKTDRPFSCSLDWLVRPTNMSKVLNGNYRNRVNGNKPGPLSRFECRSKREQANIQAAMDFLSEGDSINGTE